MTENVRFVDMSQWHPAYPALSRILLGWCGLE